ncbi:MAG: recombination-associated protein RdgC [Candidatus Polarisedimenticolaceae bacterium]|nr:recombination-associated protein RdgC [Candidatus Polarisedimenticolaceae bacterium]
MWFKNLRLYQLTKDVTFTGEELHEQLLERQFSPCSSQQPNSFGWVAPLGKEAPLLTHVTNNCIMICACQEQKILPASVIKDELEERLAALEVEEDRKIRGRERASMKDDLIFELLPRAFSKTTLTYAYIDPKNGWMVVDSPSANRAEEMISLLRESLGSFPLIPASTIRNPADVLTAWMEGEELHGGFTVQSDCELRDPAVEGSVIRCKGQDLAAAEVVAHLRAGMQVARLAIELDEKIAFTLCDDFSIKQLKFLDMIQEEASDSDVEDAATRFDVDFSIMNLELERLISKLVEIFGGAVEE